MKAAEKLARRIVAIRAGGDPDIGFKGYCEVQYAGCWGRATEYQHRKAKAHCNSEEMWDPRNGLMVCGSGNAWGCHGWIHQNPIAACKRGWTVTSSLDPAEVPVFHRGAPVFLTDDGQTVPATDYQLIEFGMRAAYGHPLTDEESTV